MLLIYKLQLMAINARSPRPPAACYIFHKLHNFPGGTSLGKSPKNALQLPLLSLNSAFQESEQFVQ